jgi:hypothetical protein
LFFASSLFTSNMYFLIVHTHTHTQHRAERFTQVRDSLHRLVTPACTKLSIIALCLFFCFFSCCCFLILNLSFPHSNYISSFSAEVGDSLDKIDRHRTVTCILRVKYC